MKIENSRLSVEVNPLGAQMTSLYDKQNARELLWQPRADVWGDQAPLLFPFVGRLKNERYVYNGRTYHIPIHGFALASRFEAAQESDTAMAFTLRSSDATKEMYPFDFTLTVRFSLRGDTLLKEHTVKNRGDGPLYYELGGHEGYNLALNAGEHMAQYALRFDAALVFTHTTDERVMFRPGTAEVPLQNGVLPLSMKTFKDDALVLDARAGESATLLDSRGQPVLTVRYAGFPYLGIWTKYLPFDTNYVCIEPWSSLPDGNYLGGEIEEKENIRKLEAGAKEMLGYSVKVY
ncbi:MAG: aldose 1-epimerase family protein [Oscillospiraceae bacterium]|nr:aldose 1-epimerase family protein [Oscillospiraceae bacterium]